ncbi:MAG: RNA polymerase sigma factor [Pirellula sp.]|nr:RNA polymerase sigma factor [Pirellula sp.]
METDTDRKEPSDVTVDWVRRAIRGEQEAFAWLTANYDGRLRALIVRRLGLQKCDIDDAVQETWVRAFRSLERYEPQYRFSTWLFTIGLRVATDMHRSKSRRLARLDSGHSLLEVVDVASLTNPNKSIEADELWASIQRWLHPSQRTALWLRYVEDLSIREIAHTMGKTQIGVRVLLHRARLELMSRLGRDLGTDALGDGTANANRRFLTQ